MTSKQWYAWRPILAYDNGWHIIWLEKIKRITRTVSVRGGPHMIVIYRLIGGGA